MSSWFKPGLCPVAGIHPAFSPKVKYLVSNKDECLVVLAQLLGSSPTFGQKLKGVLVVDKNCFFMFVNTLYWFSVILFQ